MNFGIAKHIFGEKGGKMIEGSLMIKIYYLKHFVKVCTRDTFFVMHISAYRESQKSKPFVFFKFKENYLRYSKDFLKVT